jgi:hypothetical protein
MQVRLPGLRTLKPDLQGIRRSLVSNPTYFLQSCPTCGRHLQIRVEYLGRAVACDHCRGKFIARDSSNSPPVDPADLLHRANELLESLDSRHPGRRNVSPR